MCGGQYLAAFTALACKRYAKLDMHPLCRYLVNQLKAHESFDLIVLHELLATLTVRCCCPWQPYPARPGCSAGRAFTIVMRASNRAQDAAQAELFLWSCGQATGPWQAACACGSSMPCHPRAHSSGARPAGHPAGVGAEPGADRGKRGRPHAAPACAGLWRAQQPQPALLPAPRARPAAGARPLLTPCTP